MTRYTVVWHQAAQDRLVEVWLTASDRQAVAAAASGIDQELSEDATSKGVEVDSGVFELTKLPLRVLYEVIDQDRLVKVAGDKLA